MNIKKDFCNLLEGYKKKINEQDDDDDDGDDDIVTESKDDDNDDDIVTESKGVEYTPSKLYENKNNGLKKPSKTPLSSINRLSLVQIALYV